MEINELIKTIKNKIKPKLPRGHQILLFGSWAKGNALKTSDIDIGLLGKRKIPWKTMSKILQETENIPTLRKIDIVDLNASDKTFKKEIIKYGKTI